jgi:hypothetical protein
LDGNSYALGNVSFLLRSTRFFIVFVLVRARLPRVSYSREPQTRTTELSLSQAPLLPFAMLRYELKSFADKKL